jgi:hypothetical protein
MKKYIYGHTIEGDPDLSGIIEPKTMMLLCLCNKTNAEIILDAFDQLTQLQAENERLRGYAQHKDKCDMILRCSGCDNYFDEHINPFDDCPPKSDTKRSCTCGLTPEQG